MSRYKQSQLQGKVPGSYDDNERERPWQDERDSKSLQELSQYAEADVTLTEADKPNLQHALVDQDRLLPFKKCLQTAERKTKKKKIIEMEQHDCSVN